MEPSAGQLSGTRTDYQRIAAAKSFTACTPRFAFTGRPFTEGLSNRQFELVRGCGISPRVWPDEDPRITEHPVVNRSMVQHGTTALASLGGYTQRPREPDDLVRTYKRERVEWHEHDRERSGVDKKVLRPVKVAGMRSAHMGANAQGFMHPGGIEDRPHWMSGRRDDDHLPGRWKFKPSDPQQCVPTLFARDSNFTKAFNLKGSPR